MKKKNVTLKKLQLSKRQIASLEQEQNVVGGIDTSLTCPSGCSDCPQPTLDPQTCFPPPQSVNVCITGPSGCLCPSQFPICQPTQQDCITQHSCGGFMCEVGGFGGIA